PWPATGWPWAPCMPRPRKAMTSDFPARKTLMRSFVAMFGISSAPELEDLGDVQMGGARRDDEGRQEDRRRSQRHEEDGVPREHEEVGDGRSRGTRGARCQELRGEEGGPQADARPDHEADEHDDERLADEESGRLPAARPAR